MLGSAESGSRIETRWLMSAVQCCSSSSSPQMTSRNGAEVGGMSLIEPVAAASSIADAVDPDGCSILFDPHEAKSTDRSRADFGSKLDVRCRQGIRLPPARCVPHPKLREPWRSRSTGSVVGEPSEGPAVVSVLSEPPVHVGAIPIDRGQSPALWKLLHHTSALPGADGRVFRPRGHP